MSVTCFTRASLCCLLGACSAAEEASNPQDAPPTEPTAEDAAAEVAPSAPLADDDDLADDDMPDHEDIPADDMPSDDLADDVPSDDLADDDDDDLADDDMPDDEDIPADDVPSDDVPGDDMPSDDVPGDDMPSDDMPSDDDMPDDDVVSMDAGTNGPGTGAGGSDSGVRCDAGSARCDAGKPTRDGGCGMQEVGTNCSACGTVQCGGSCWEALPTPECGSFACRLPGIGGGLWLDGQDPRRGDRYTAAQARERIGRIAGATEAIRLYGAEADREAACIAKFEFGLEVMLGIWIDANSTPTAPEVVAGLEAANDGCVDILAVGNEVLLRGEQSPENLAAIIQQVQAQAPPGVRVGTAEVWDRLVQHPQVIEAGTVVIGHAHSFWAEVSTNSAVKHAKDAHDALSALAGDREVILGEVGIPTSGTPRGAAVPSVEAANQFLVEMNTWARAEGVQFFYFSAYDEAWKSGEPNGVGTHWGIWNSDGTFKDGLQDVFDCLTREPNLGNTVLSCPGPSNLTVTSVPPLGSSDNLFGTVCHVAPNDVKLAVYIQVNNAWWVKPYSDERRNIVPDVDGNWVADITTGGNDSQATAIAVFLLDRDTEVPVALNAAQLPPSLDPIALGSSLIER